MREAARAAESKDVIFLFYSEVLYGFGKWCCRNRIMKEYSSFPINITFSEEHISLVFLIFQRGHFVLKESSVIDKSFNNERKSIDRSTNNFVKILSRISLFSFEQTALNPIKYSLRTKRTLKGK